MRSLRAIEGSGGSTAGQSPRETRDNAGWCGQARERQHGGLAPGCGRQRDGPSMRILWRRAKVSTGRAGAYSPERLCSATLAHSDGTGVPGRSVVGTPVSNMRLNHRTRPVHMTAGLVGFLRDRRHSHRHARSAPSCGVSHGPRAYRVRVPIILPSEPALCRSPRSRRSAEIPRDIPGDDWKATAQPAHCQAAWRYSHAPRSGEDCRSRNYPRPT